MFFLNFISTLPDARVELAWSVCMCMCVCVYVGCLGMSGKWVKIIAISRRGCGRVRAGTCEGGEPAQRRRCDGHNNIS